jgi:NADH-quinone oxidoreductase subunit H
VSSELLQLAEIIIYPGLLFIFVVSFLYEWVDRKFYARLQNRYGPLYTGPKGILQPFADFLKLLAKEDIEPEAVDKAVFRATPLLLLFLPLLGTLLVPIGGLSAVINFEGDLIFMAFLLTLIAISIFLAGWSSTNRFSTLGGVRAALQMISFEIPLTLSLISPAIMAGSLSITGIVLWQSTRYPSIVFQPIGFAVAIICFLAELERVPFDIPEADTEIVAGWMTEFSGRKLALLRLSRDVETVLAAALLSAVFLGGPAGPGPPQLALLWFFLKTTIVVLILTNLRALFARIRIDQMMQTFWKYVLPLSLLQIFLSELVSLLVL